MLFSEEDSFISFKMYHLSKLCEMLTYTKPDAGSVPVTLALSCLLEGLKTGKEGKDRSA